MESLITYKRKSRCPWSDLRQDIVGFIINKLHFLDQIRALAVCKNWRVCKAYITSSDHLPWVVSYRHFDKENSDKMSFMCKLFDPYSQKIVSKEVCMDVVDSYVLIVDSKNGWLLLGEDNLFLHNPLTNHIIDLPLSVTYQSNPIRVATMSASPTSSQCGIFMLSIEDMDLYLSTWGLSKLDNMKTLVDEIDETVVDEFLYSMLYMKGSIYYALFENPELNLYSLKDGSSQLLASGFPEPYESYVPLENVWLTEVDGNLLIVRMDRICEPHKWMIFRFDWSKMSWVAETNLKSCAIYIAGNVAFSAPCTNDRGEILEDFRLFYLDERDDDSDDMEVKCYSLSVGGGTRIQSNEAALEQANRRPKTNMQQSD